MGSSEMQTQTRHFDWLSTFCRLNKPHESHDPPFGAETIDQQVLPTNPKELIRPTGTKNVFHNQSFPLLVVYQMY